MKIQFSTTQRPLTTDEVSRLELRLGLSLPIAYREFLITSNGGRPQLDYVFNIPNWIGKKSIINDFYGIYPGEYLDLEENISFLKGKLPPHLIPIAEDPAGNYILLSCNTQTGDIVYFWDHEDEPAEYSDKIENYSNIYRLSTTFIDFVQNLQIRHE